MVFQKDRCSLREKWPRLLNQVKAQPTIRLNRQTACPPRAAVSVNHGNHISSFTHGIPFAFDNGGDHPSYVGIECNGVKLFLNAGFILML